MCNNELIWQEGAKLEINEKSEIRIRGTLSYTYRDCNNNTGWRCVWLGEANSFTFEAPRLARLANRVVDPLSRIARSLEIKKASHTPSLEVSRLSLVLDEKPARYSTWTYPLKRDGEKKN